MDLTVKDDFHMMLCLALFLELRLRKTWRNMKEKALETAGVSSIFFDFLKRYLTLIFERENLESETCMSFA